MSYCCARDRHKKKIIINLRNLFPENQFESPQTSVGSQVPWSIGTLPRLPTQSVSTGIMACMTLHLACFKPGETSGPIALSIYVGTSLGNYGESESDVVGYSWAVRHYKKKLQKPFRFNPKVPQYIRVVGRVWDILKYPLRLPRSTDLTQVHLNRCGDKSCTEINHHE